MGTETERTVDDLKGYLSILAEEYKSLRDESKQANANMFAGLRWGPAVLGIVIAGAFTQWNKEHAVVLLTFFILVPLLSAMTMFLWLGEAARFKRVGDFICLIEQKVGLVLDEFKHQSGLKEKWATFQAQMEDSISISSSSLDLSDPIVWEQWLRGMKGKNLAVGHLAWVYIVRLLFFVILMVFSFLTGSYYVLTHPKLIPAWLTPLQGLVPDSRTKVALLMVLSFMMIAIATSIAYWIGRQLKTEARSIQRDQITRKPE